MICNTSTLVKSIDVMLKWKRHRDTVRSLYLYDKENGEKKYRDVIRSRQKIIHSIMRAEGLSIIEAVTKVIEEALKNRGMEQMRWLSAAYELAQGNDFAAAEY